MRRYVKLILKVNLLLLSGIFLPVSCSHKNDANPDLSALVSGKFRVYKLEVYYNSLGFTVSYPFKMGSGAEETVEIELLPKGPEEVSVVTTTLIRYPDGKSETESETVEKVTLKRATDGTIAFFEGGDQIGKYENRELVLTRTEASSGVSVRRVLTARQNAG